jgi:hypothetical protein
MEEFNILTDLYLPKVKQDNILSSNEYKHLNENNIDTADIEGVEKDPDAGEIVFDVDKELADADKDIFLKDVYNFVFKDIPRDTLIAGIRGGSEGFKFINNLVGAVMQTEGIPLSELPTMEINKRIDDFQSKLDLADKDSPFVSKMIGMIGQDAAFTYPIYKKLQKAKVPMAWRMPISFALGGALAFDKETSWFANSTSMQNLKTLIGIEPETPLSEMYDKSLQAIEFGAFGKIFDEIPKIYKTIKNSRKQTVEQVGTALGGSAITGTVLHGNINKEDDNQEIPALEIIDEDNEVGDQSALPGTVNKYGYELTAGVNPVVKKMLDTKAGEVLPSLKKLGTEGFIKKTEVNFNKLAEEGKIGRDWYKRSGDNILKFVGGDKKAADEFAQLLAIYSPQKPIPTNTQFAIKAYNRFRSGEKIWEGEILEKAKLPENLNITQTNNFKKDLLAKYGGAKKVKGEKSTGLELVDLGDGNLMVVRHGDYSNIAEKTKDLKAHLLMNENISWSGRKTNSFYGNIMKEINPELKQRATIDLWMNRAGGFVNQELKDGPKYNYIESIVDTVAKKKNWDIDQAQAAIWVSTKARFDTTKAIFAEKALSSGIGIRKGGSVIPVKGKEKEFADLRFNTAMDYKIASQDIDKAALNFADALENNLAYVSWETVPGKFSKHLNQLEKASPEIKSEYHFKVSQMLTDDKGTDIIAKKLKILSPGHFEAPGYFQGVTNPSGQTKIATTRIKGAGKDITTMDAPSQTLLEQYAAIRGLALSQDAIGYHRLILAASKKNANSVAIKFDKKFTPDQFKKFGQNLDKEFGDGHALISKEKGVLVLNVGDLDNIEFQKRLKNLAENTIETDATFMYYKNGNLITKEATDYGKSYREIIEGLQRSDIRQLFRDILTKKKSLDKEFSRKYGFDYDEKAFEEIESFIKQQ